LIPKDATTALTMPGSNDTNSQAIFQIYKGFVPGEASCGFDQIEDINFLIACSVLKEIVKISWNLCL
jgi:hypothetical protein